ncbi:hypothetical protein PRNP1_001074 [Phytophthora ramorum]
MLALTAGETRGYTAVANLLVAPSHLLAQWKLEVYKLVKDGEIGVVLGLRQFLEMMENPASILEEEAIGRVLGMGQTNEFVTVGRLIAEDTVEETLIAADNFFFDGELGDAYLCSAPFRRVVHMTGTHEVSSSRVLSRTE